MALHLAAVLAAGPWFAGGLLSIPAAPARQVSPEIDALAPVLVVVVTALLVIVADWFLTDDDVRVPAGVSLVGLAGAAYMLAAQWQDNTALAFARTVTMPDGVRRSVALLSNDAFARYVGVVVLLAAAASIVFGADGRWRPRLAKAEYFALVLFAAAGMMLGAAATDMVLLFLCLEVFSIASYVLAAFVRGVRLGHEAALKYFVLGSAAAAFFLYGVALVYAVTGTTSMATMGAVLAERQGDLPPMVPVGLALVLVGLGFKVAVVPFHQWTPDVYQGAPTPVTAFLSAATKAAAFAALMRVLWTAFPSMAASWQGLLAVLAVLTMFSANLAALVQTDLKRMLGYSAIAHAGYILVAVSLGTAAGHAAALYYLLVYAIMNLGAFGVVGLLGGGARPDNDPVRTPGLESLRGLARRQPWLALALTVFLLGLTGLPPFAGFVGKWYIFRASVDAAQVVLAVAIVANSVLAAFYYLRPIVYMYAGEPADEARERVPIATGIVVGALAALTVLALVWATPLVEGAQQAGASGGLAVGGVPDAGDAAGSHSLYVPMPMAPTIGR